MRARLAQVVPLLFLLGAQFVSPSVLAQVSPCLERRPPISSLADDLQQRKADSPKQMVSIESVAFEGAFAWPDPVRAEITGKLTQSRFDASTDWIARVEELARGALQDRGYFQSMPKATTQVFQDDPLHPRVSVTLRDDHREIFRLAEIRFRNAKANDPKLAFPSDQLRKLIPISNGEIFNTEKIRQGLEALRRLYGTKGYIDFTATPLTEVDQKHHRIWLTLELDEQTQFLIEKIEILGLNSALEKRLRDIVPLGAPLNYLLVDNFLQDNKASLPAGASRENIDLKRDVEKSTVSLQFDFRPPCSGLAAPPPNRQD